MNYLQTLNYLYTRLPMYQRIGAPAYKANLDNTAALCKMLGNPQHAFRSVHVTGTNGKGSVSHMLASVLQTAGFRTGLYTSPHLKDFRERIRVDGKMIRKGHVSSFVKKYSKEFEPIEPSFFELTVGMAFDWFREREVDIAVIEAGLGGRLDSTNIVTPLLSVITNVSFDHMEFLGDSLEKIAGEKAGIIKPGIPVVVGEGLEETRAVFERQAQLANSAISYADRRFRVTSFETTGRNTNAVSMDMTRDGEPWLEGLISPLTGNYQKKNMATVMGAIEQLNRQGFGLTPAVIRKGIRDVIKNTGLAGRWQILGRDPLVICDTGHNEGGLQEVLAQISATPHKRLHFVFGVVNDKHLPPILGMLPADASYYFCKPDIPRGLDVAALHQQAVAAGLEGSCHPSVKDALQAARMNAGKNDLVFIGGSTFVVAEVV